MNLYKILIDITVPCQAGSCNANLVRDTIKSYVAKSYEEMKESVTGIVGDWTSKLFEVLPKILAYAQSCDDLQFTLQDVSSEISDLSTQICEMLRKCDGLVVDKFLRHSKYMIPFYFRFTEPLTCSAQPMTSSEWLMTSGRLEALSPSPTVS